jgi:Uri superfamily endonuclease
LNLFDHISLQSIQGIEMESGDEQAEYSEKITGLRTAQQSGCYSIIVDVTRALEFRVGRLGRILFPAGYYVYTGRAKKGIGQRVRRHFKKKKPCHWHIDYLTSREDVRVMEAIVYSDNADEECAINQRLSRLPGSRVFAPGFGSSDCVAGCGSHLLYFKRRPRRIGHAV